MRHRHLTKTEIRRLVERDHDELSTALLLHLLATCPDCYAVGGHILDLYLAGRLPERFSSVDLDLAQSRSEAPKLFEKLRRFGSERQKGLIRDTRTFRSWGLAELLCRESLEAASADPQRALELAELAVLLSSQLRPWEPAEEAWLFQLLAYAWAHLGNARRILGELRSAEEAFRKSDAWWAHSASMGDVLDYEATILCLKASLARTQGRFDEALSILAAALAAAADDLRPKILAARAFTLGEAGDLPGAAAAFREAIDAAHTATPRLAYILHHNLLDTLSKAGEYAEAEALLPKVRSLSRNTGDKLDLVRLQWIEARVHAGAGDPRRAIELLERVRLEFQRRTMHFDAALSGLELAHIHLAEGNHEAVERIARDLLAIFEAQTVPREALATLLVFCRAAEARVATAELASVAIEALKHATKHERG